MKHRTIYAPGLPYDAMAERFLVDPDTHVGSLNCPKYYMQVCLYPEIMPFGHECVNLWHFMSVYHDSSCLRGERYCRMRSVN